MFLNATLPEPAERPSRTRATSIYGRFLQVDPVGYDDQINLYAYVSNDPVNRIDHTGLREICWNVDNTHWEVIRSSWRVGRCAIMCLIGHLSSLDRG